MSPRLQNTQDRVTVIVCGAQRSAWQSHLVFGRTNWKRDTDAQAAEWTARARPKKRIATERIGAEVRSHAVLNKWTESRICWIAQRSERAVYSSHS
jgi:hypothetical protein